MRRYSRHGTAISNDPASKPSKSLKPIFHNQSINSTATRNHSHWAITLVYTPSATILKKNPFILHFMINSEYFLTIKAAFGGLEFHLGLEMCNFGELMGDNRGRNHCCDVAWTARIGFVFISEKGWAL